MVLRDNLMLLLKKKQLSSITVKELCEKADINRSTFYDHFRDVFHLMDYIEEEIIEDLTTYLSQYNFAEEAEESLQMTEKLLEYIATRYDTCQILLNENNDPSFERRITEVTQQFLMRNISHKNYHDTTLSKYAGTFLIGGGIYVIKRWLENNMDQSIEQIAWLINSIDIEKIR